jgi:hypothetical protein
MGNELTMRCQSGDRPARRAYSPPRVEVVGTVAGTILGGTPGGGDSTGSRTQQPYAGEGGRPMPPPTR